MTQDLNIVTGAFGFTGRHITRRLLVVGKQVKTLTGHPDLPNEFGDQISAAPLDFDNPDELAKNLQGASILFNTYWVRFTHGETTFDKAVQNSKTLIKAAEDAGVQRIIHISITNPSNGSPLPYYRGKAEVEDAIRQSKLSYGILRPNVIFGDEGILINNIAWMLRKFPVFAIPGSGECKIQPIYVDDLAELAFQLAEKEENAVIDAVGPETYTYNDLLNLIANKLGIHLRAIHIHPRVALFLSSIIGRFIGDVVLKKHYR